MYPTILEIVLSSAVVAAIVSGGVQFFFWFLDKSKEGYETLYGPLRYHLVMMKIITKNQTEISSEIQNIGNMDMRIESLHTHLSPLTIKWLEHRDIIKSLLATYPGFIKKSDAKLMDEFLDACLKREIIQEGQNALANEERTDKIIAIVEKLQDRLL